MRLICPNCTAQYEVDASLIPDEGRDVQCSNCGNTWFELPALASEPAEAPLVEDEGEEPGDDVADAEPETVQEPETKPEPVPAAAKPASARKDSSLDWPDEDDDDDLAPKSAAIPTGRKRPKDLAAVDVLKEEAARELDKRRTESPSTLETQGEFGLDGPRDHQTPSRALRARMARMKSEDTGDTDAPEEADYSAPRRDLLPDIEEINSSLGPAGGKIGPLEAESLARQRGFRYGFVLTAGAAILAIAAYAWAPAIASALPGSEGALLGYVDWANGARDALDRLIGRVSGG